MLEHELTHCFPVISVGSSSAFSFESLGNDVACVFVDPFAAAEASPLSRLPLLLLLAADDPSFFAPELDVRLAELLDLDLRPRKPDAPFLLFSGLPDETLKEVSPV